MTTELIPYQEQSITAYQPGAEIMPMADLFARFIKATSKRSLHTARSYQRGAGVFLQFLGLKTDRDIARLVKEAHKSDKGRVYYKTVWEIRGDTTPLLDVDLALLDDFSLWLAQDGQSQGTINQRLAAVNSFLSVALRDKVISRDQGVDLGLEAYKARQRRDHQTTGRRLDPGEVRSLRATVTLRAKTDPKAARDLAIIDLMLFAGLRRSEVATLGVTDIKPDGGRLWLHVTGKGGKTRRVKLHDVVYGSLADWLKLTGRELGNGCSGPVFYNLQKGGEITSNPLNGSVIGRLVAEYGAAAGLAPQEAPRDESGKTIRGVVLAPHDLRRTCARNARENGAALEKIQAMLGHSDVKTTMIYIGEFEDDTDTAVDYVRYAQ